MSGIVGFSRALLACFVSCLLILKPFVANAEGTVIAVDTSAATANQPKLDVAPNGVPVVNIVAPTAGGVSRNTFTDFNVGQEGLILNNSLVLGVSQLGGALLGNPNFTSGQSAKIILNEVTGTNRSNLLGATEIFGSKAEYVLANPNGITCNGCGFINTPRVTLTTGLPQLSNGNLIGFDVEGGDVLFEGLDVNATNIDSFDIITRTAKLTSAIYAGKELNVITGRNNVDYASKTATSKADNGSTKPALAVDSSALGGMYAGKIGLVSTEAGVGVKTDGALAASAEDVVITADGRIEYRSASASGSVRVSGNSVKQSGDAYAKQNIEINSQGTIELQDGFTAAGGDVKLFASDDVNNFNLLLAGVDAQDLGNEITFTNNGNGSLLINAGGDFNNTGDAISSSGLQIVSSNVNNSGTLSSTGNLQLVTGNLDNSGGVLYAAGDLLLVTDNITSGQQPAQGVITAYNNGNVASSNLGNGGTIQAQGSIDININNNYIINGSIATNDHIDITAWSVTNNADVQAADYILLTLTQDGFTNSSDANLISNTSVTINAQNGDVRNEGEISAPDIDIDIANGNLTNILIQDPTDLDNTKDNGVISSSDPTATSTINVNGNIFNYGRLSSSGYIDITAINLKNGQIMAVDENGNILKDEDGVLLTAETGQISSDKDLSIATSGYINNVNSSLLYATQNLTLHTTSLTNIKSNIFSMDGDITIDKTAGVKNTAVTNTSGRIEALAGDIWIDTDNFINQRLGGSGISVAQAPYRVNADGSITYTYNQQWLIDNLPGYVNDTTDVANVYYYDSRVDNTIRVYIFRIQGDTSTGLVTSESAFITAGNDITINAGNFTNYNSQIAADRDVTIKATGTIDNHSQTYQEWAHFYATNSYHWYNSMQDPNLADFIEDAHWHYNPDWFHASPLKTMTLSSTLYAGGILTVRGEKISNTSTRFGGLSSITGTRDANSADITISGAVDTSLFANLPAGDNGLFKVNTAPGSNYLIETNVAFIDLSRFMGSEYFLNAIGYVLPNGTKLLGDAFYETRLVSEAIFARTGQRYLNNGIGTDLAQMQLLMDNAFAQMAALDLEVGIELTATQIASLNSDIMWLVEDVINGQRVLKPVIYLASATLEGLNAEGSQMIAGNNATVVASGSLINGGLILASNDISLVSGLNLYNTGKIKAGRDITLVSAGDINNAATIIRTTQGTRLGAFTQAQGEIIAGRDATLIAGGDINNTASNITSGGDTTLAAVGDVNITTEALHNHREYKTKSFHSVDDTVENVGSTITSGGNFTANAGNNINIAGSDITAAGDANLTAANDVNITSVQDSEYHMRKITKKSSAFGKWTDFAYGGGFGAFGGGKDSNSKNEKQTVTQIASNISGNNVNITSGANTVVVASNLTAANDVNINAGGVAYLGSAKDSAYENNSKSTKSTMWQTQKGSGHSDETVVHTKINAGGDVNINAVQGVVVDVKNFGTLEKSIDTLSKEPGLEYLATLQNQNNVAFNKVSEAHKNWNYSQSGLTPEGAAIIAIAVTVATAGAGAAMGGAAASSAGVGAGVTATTATGSVVLTGASGVMANAALSTLAAQASVSLINNKGDIGKVLQDMGSDETVKNLAFSVVTAGLTAGSINPNGGIVAAAQNATADALVKAGVKGIVYSDDFIESSIGYLKYAAVDIAGAGISEQIGVTSGAFADSGLNTALGTASYAALGCAMGAATTGNCGSGALASTSGALAGKVGISNDIGGLIAASIIASTGGSVKEIYGANNVGNAANLGETIAQNITPAYYNPATGEVFNAYGQLLGTSATVVGDTLTGFSPVYASGWIDEYNGDSPAPNIWPGMGLTPSETGADFDVDTSTKDPIIPQFPASLVSNTKANPILIFLNQVMPTVRSDTQLHDPYIVKIGATDAGTKAVTIPSVFMYNTYGMFGTILDIPNYEQNTTNIAKDVIYGAPNATK